MNLLETTIDMVRDCEVPARDICKELSVTTRWLDKVLDGDIKEPSVVKIEKLHKFLLKKGVKPRKRKRRKAA